MSSQITPLFPVSGTDTAKVQGIPVSTVDPINGQVLVYKSATSQYEPAVATTGATEIILGTNDNLFAEVSTFTFLGDPATWLGQYFTIGVPEGQAYVWFDKEDNAGDPAPAGFVRGIGIDAGDAAYGSPSQNRTLYANRMVTVFSTDPDLSATKSGDVITLTSRANGERSNIALVTISGSDASVAVVTDGGGMKGSVVLKSGNANADVSIKNIDGNIRFEKSSGNVVLGNAAGTVALTSDLPTLGTGAATALAINVGTAGAFVVNGGALGTPSSGTVTNLTGTASININGTVGATTAATGAFTTVSANSKVLVANGSLAAPAYSFTASTNTGIVHGDGGTNRMSLVTGGVIMLYLDNGNNRVALNSSSHLGWSSGSPSVNALDCLIWRDAAGLLGLRNGTTNSVGLSSYNTYTNSTNYERASFRWSSNVLKIGTEKLGSGTARDLDIQTDGVARINISATGATTFTGDVSLTKTITATGTTGTQPINKSSGTVNFAAAASSLVVTNSLVTVNSIIQLTVGTNDTTMRSAIAVAAAGSFTIYPTNAPTAETRVYFTITN
jgi:hypothetical protein